MIVVAGTNEDHETEGNDKTDIALPGRQDEFIEAISAVHGRVIVIVVVNAGSPVSMPWLDSVSAVLLPFFGGIEMGEAMADIQPITGSGDRPTTVVLQGYVSAIDSPVEREPKALKA